MINTACAIIAAAAAAFTHTGREEIDLSGARAVGQATQQRAMNNDSNSGGGPGGGIAGGPSATWQPLGPFGGDVQAVGISPINSNIALAGVAPAGSTGGTLYRSADAALSWTAVAALAGKSVYAVDFAPDGTAFIGTIDGVWRSNPPHDGASWTALNLGIGLNDQVFAVAVDPNDPNVIWCGVADAIGSQPVNVMRSSDGGTTWVNRTPPLASPMSCRGIAINPNDSQEVYACFGGGFGGGQIWASFDGGDSWVNRSAGLPNTPMNEVRHDGARVLVCGGQQFGSQNFGLYASTNAGLTWAPLHSGAWPSLVVHDVKIDPNNAQVIYVATPNAGAFRSTDGGSNWQFGAGGSGSFSLNSVGFTPQNSNFILLGANSLGVARSTNGGATFNLSSVGMGSLDVWSIAANPLNPNEMAIAFQGANNGGVYTSLNAGQTWTLEPVPGTRYNTVSFAPNGTLYAISDGPIGGGQEGVYRRNGGFGASWTLLGPDQGPLFESRLFALEFSTIDPNVFFVAGADFGVAGSEATIWRTTDAGQTWTKVYEGPQTSEVVTDVRIVNNTNGQTVLASFVNNSGAGSTGGALRSLNGGAGGVGSWFEWNVGLPVLVQAAGISRSPISADTFFLADRQSGANGGLYRTDDAGETWANTGYNNQVRDVLADPNDPNVIFIMGLNPNFVRKSTDSGATFAPFIDGLVFTGTARDLAFAPAGGGGGGAAPKLLLASTVGSWSIALSAPQIRGDLNNDGIVNVDDLLVLLAAWGDCPPKSECVADIAPQPDGDGLVNVDDLLVLLANWG